MRVAEDDPQAGAVGFVVTGTNGAGELGDFNTRAAEEVGKNTASVIDQIAKALRHKDNVHIARRRLFELVKIVVRERLFERDFDGGRGLVLVWNDADGHGGYGFTPRGLFRIGAAGEDGKGAVELLGEHDAGGVVGKGDRAERKILR